MNAAVNGPFADKKCHPDQDLTCTPELKVSFIPD
jgi:hypothetical protein